jgi:hypothetical protein
VVWVATTGHLLLLLLLLLPSSVWASTRFLLAATSQALLCMACGAM